MASEQSVNPMLTDPSIIQITSPKSTTNAQFNTLDNSAINIEAGNTLSQLLDSAMAKAAKETTPELEPISTSSSPVSFVYNSKVEKGYVYSIEQLMRLRESPFVKNYKNSDKLPDKGFWRSKVKAQNGSSNSSKEYRQKKGSSYSRKHQNEPWDKRQSDHKNNDLDKLSSEKISQLLGEKTDETDPEWESSNLNDGLMDMGSTVEDFEKWKLHMKLEERKKKGGLVDSEIAEIESSNNVFAENSGNEVDNFFSFVKPKIADTTNSGNSSYNVNQCNTRKTQSETTGKSSRFSSFFNPPSFDSNTPLPEARSSPASYPSSTEQSQSDFSRFFSGSNSSPQKRENTVVQKGVQIPPPPVSAPMIVPQSSTTASSQSNQNSNIQLPMNNTNDSFFLSLLKKNDSGPSTNVSTVVNQKNSSPPEKPVNSYTNISTQPVNKPSIQNQQPPVFQQTHQVPQQPPHLQLQQGSSQGEEQSLPQSKTQDGHQFNPNQPPNQKGQIPPWMKQFNANGPPPFPPHMPYNPAIGRPSPQGMIPPGFLPPPGMPPPQFTNNNRFPPTQFMGFPPGMPPPPGFQQHLYQQQQQQHHQQQPQQKQQH